MEILWWDIWDNINLIPPCMIGNDKNDCSVYNWKQCVPMEGSKRRPTIQGEFSVIPLPMTKNFGPNLEDGEKCPGGRSLSPKDCRNCAPGRVHLHRFPSNSVTALCNHSLPIQQPSTRSTIRSKSASSRFSISRIHGKGPHVRFMQFTDGSLQEVLFRKQKLHLHAK